MIAQIIISIFLVFMLPGCGGAPLHPPAELVGISLPEICGHYHVQWQWDGVTQVVFLEYKGNKAKALVGSSTVLFGKEKITLSAPLRRAHSTIYVPEDFESKVLAPFGVSIGGLFPRADTLTSRVHAVVIDPGHGGRDPGAKGITGVLEKDVVLDIAKRLKNFLREAGMDVTMTREGDEFISLAQRTAIATKSNADLFVSVHANSNPSRRMQGMEVYYARTRTKKDLEEDQRWKNEREFLRKLKAKESSSLQGIVADMMYHFKIAESARLAQKIASTTCSYVDAANHGVQSCRFFVVRNTLIPAVLIETGFLTNRAEERKLNSNSYRQKLAEAIARSILEYAND